MRTKGIPEYLIRIIESMYVHIEVCMDTGLGGLSDVFTEEVGVKQGSVLGPLLFLLMINDLPQFLREFCGFDVSDCALLRLGTFLIICLLFADDAVLVAETPDQMQCLLDGLYSWSMRNRMVVSREKTHVVVFSDPKRPPPTTPRFFYGSGGTRVEIIVRDGIEVDMQELSVVGVAKYLGLRFDSDGSWASQHKHVATVGLFASKQYWQRVESCAGISATNRHLLWESTVLATVLYGVELFGLGDCTSLERLQTAYLRRAVNLPFFCKTGNLLAEFGRFPVECEIVRRLFRLLHRIAFAGDRMIVWHALKEAANAYRGAKGFWWPRYDGDDAWATYGQRRNWFRPVAHYVCCVLCREDLLDNIFDICHAETREEAKAERTALDSAVRHYFLERDRLTRASDNGAPGLTLHPCVLGQLYPVRGHSDKLSRCFSSYVDKCVVESGGQVDDVNVVKSSVEVVADVRPCFGLHSLFADTVRVDSLLGRGQGRYHRLCHPVICVPPYLTCELPLEICSLIAQLRLGVLPIAVSLRRKERGVDGNQLCREERICPYCDAVEGVSVVEDEVHFLLQCPLYSRERSELVRRVERVGLLWPDGRRYLLWASTSCDLTVLFVSLLLSHDREVLTAIGYFIRTALARRVSWVGSTQARS